jgi:RNA polymerase sigma-70 factor (ECF subfamily)
MEGSTVDWTGLIEEHGPALLLYARQWTDSLAEAEDVLQDAFVRAWRSRANITGPALPYLFTTVRHAAIDALRSKKRRKTREETVLQSEIEPPPLFESSLERDEKRRAVQETIARLPRPQREVLVMKIWGDLTFKEIGRTLGISQNTAASRYRYALEALRRKLPREINT